MDDVWVVIGLLLFGSLLFCLCCYKVTNLLYMLYHIDDSTESLTANDINNATTASAVAAAIKRQPAVTAVTVPVTTVNMVAAAAAGQQQVGNTF